VKKCSLAVIGQSADLAPADKKLYALRDVTATVNSIPLIASSIMSKKLAAGTRSIVLDVKCGSGAFMNTPELARELAEAMVAIGKSRGRRTAAVITNMDLPLGHAIGNAIEVKEAIEVLTGNGPDDLREVCLKLASVMLSLSLGITEEEGLALAVGTLESGKAYGKFCEWIALQGGDAAYAKDPSLFGESLYEREIKAGRDGYILSCNAEAIGIAAMKLGAGRETKDDAIDFSAGIIVHKKVGEAVKSGDVIATLYTNKESAIASAARTVRGAVTVSCDKPSCGELIYAVIK
jgi:pyrimidine-nucleoside phosphorylase